MTSSTADFNRALEYTLILEGGWWPGTAKSDPNPTMHGVTQKTYNRFLKLWGLPPTSVRNITKEQERLIYVEYWNEAGCRHLDWPVSAMHFDTSVNSGPGTAIKLGKRAGYNLDRYFAVRQAFFDAIIVKNPDKAPNGPGWRKRLSRLRTFLERSI
jgi:lysozyme family protein